METNDGGYVIVGVTDCFGSGRGDFWLVKTDSFGVVEWNKTYGGVSEDHPQLSKCVVQTSDGGYTLAGYTASFGAGLADFWLVKTDSAGNEQWNQTYGGTNTDVATSLVQTSDGGYAMGGYTKSFGSGDLDIWLVKTDATGIVQWNQTYGGLGWEDCFSIVQTTDGGYALASRVDPFSGKHDAWLIKTDLNGKMQWNRTYGGSYYDEWHSIVQTGDGGYALAGYTQSLGDGNGDFWLVKTDSDGNSEWQKTYGTRGNSDIAWSVVLTSDGGYAIAGSSTSFGAGGTDFWLVKTDSAGNEQWNQTYGGINSDIAYSVIETNDWGYAIAGRTDSFGAGYYDFCLVKVAGLYPKRTAALDIHPDALNLKSKGQWITAYIQLPEGHDPADIDATTILLNATIQPVLDPKYGFVANTRGCLVDHNGDRILERMVKFDRAEVMTLLSTGEVALTVTGQLFNGIPFEGSDTIKVIAEESARKN